MFHIQDSNNCYEGSTVIIRSVTASDAPLIHTWMQKKFFDYYKPYLRNICPTPSSLAQRIEMQSSLDPPFEIEALVLHRPSLVPIGLVSLSNFDYNNLKAECSIAFHRRLGTRCVAETLAILFYNSFSKLQLNKIFFYVTSDNDKVLRMLHRYGITQEGKLLKEILSESGEWIDLYRFCILRSDWDKSLLYKRLASIQGAFK